MRSGEISLSLSRWFGGCIGWIGYITTAVCERENSTGVIRSASLMMMCLATQQYVYPEALGWKPAKAWPTHISDTHPHSTSEDSTIAWTNSSHIRHVTLNSHKPCWSMFLLELSHPTLGLLLYIYKLTNLIDLMFPQHARVK